jgi:hypothetical protein
MVSMMLPSALVELLEELEFELPRSAIEPSMNDEIIDWADWALVEDNVPDVVPEELEVLPVRALIKLWNAELRLEVTLLEAPDPPFRLPSNSLLADSVARLVSAAIVEAMLGDELAAELDVLLVIAGVPGVAAAWLLLTLPIDIMVPITTAGIRVVGRDSNNLSRMFCSAACPSLHTSPRISSFALGRQRFRPARHLDRCRKRRSRAPYARKCVLCSSLRKISSRRLRRRRLAGDAIIIGRD